jgi:outer membrane protein assembly factor BamB
MHVCPSRSSLNAIFVAGIIFFATILGTFVGANFAFGQDRQGQADKGYNWVFPAYDKQATNFNPQIGINKDTIGDLTDSWTTALPIPRPIPGIEPISGGSAIPLAVGGIIYLPTNYLTIFVHQAETGKGLWSYTYPVNMTEVVQKIPSIRPYQSGLLYGITYFDGDIYMPLSDCSITILDSLSGTPKFVGDLAQGRMCQNVPGNGGYYTGQMLYGPVFYEKGNVLITATGVSGRVDSGRGFVAGFDAKTGRLLWRFFLMPPAGGDRNWAQQYKGKGNVDPVEGDWGDARGVGVGVGFGAWAVDEDTGTVYLGTSAPAPNFNATRRPGPNLFSSSILALDATTGELKWYYQTSSHDLAGHGCAWNVALGKIADKKVVFKACANGKTYALDAATGKLVWSFKPPSVKYLNVDSGEGRRDLQKNWTIAPARGGYWQCPGISGAVEGDIAVGYNTVYLVTYNFCDYLENTAVERTMLDSFGGKEVLGSDGLPREMPKNATVYALDATTGNVKWVYGIPEVPHRGGLVVSGELVYIGGLDGNLYALRADNGDVALKKFFGASLGLPPSVAADAAGRPMLYQMIGGLQPRWGQTVSGIVVALKLRQSTAPQPQTLGTPSKETTTPQPQPSPIPQDLLIPIVAAVVVVVLFGALAMRGRGKGKKR